jgi:hypothetical protein
MKFGQQWYNAGKNVANKAIDVGAAHIAKASAVVGEKGAYTAAKDYLKSAGIEQTAKRWVNEGVSGKVVDTVGGLVRFNENGQLGLSGTGKLAFGGMATLAIGFNTWNAIDEKDMGTTDGTVMRATPSIRSYLQNPQQAPGGADGSLVFALHNNRRGGYL